MLAIPNNLEAHRVCAGPYASRPHDPYGAFDRVPGPCGEKLTFVVSDGLYKSDRYGGWEHVSVSIAKIGKARLPNWLEMSFAKDLFWQAEDCVVQFHPPKSEYVSNYRVLHLWRSLRHEIPRPAMGLVGVQALGELDRTNPQHVQLARNALDGELT